MEIEQHPLHDDLHVMTQQNLDAQMHIKVLQLNGTNSSPHNEHELSIASEEAIRWLHPNLTL